MIAVWIINFINQSKLLQSENSKGKHKLSLLEFGPGRGTLMVDILRTFQQFNLLEGLELNFIEASPFMAKLQ